MRQMMELLEARQLLSTEGPNWVLTPEGVVTVAGTRNNDEIVIYRIKNSLALKFNGRVVAAFELSQITEVQIFGNGGNDNLRANVPVRAIIVGGEGNDFIRGGRGDDILVGGGGRDRIEGGDGNDILRGEDGDDTLNGGSGDDILYGGIDTLNDQGKPRRNTLNGGSGFDIAIASGSANDQLNSIEQVQDENWRPEGREFPETISFVRPEVFVSVSDRDVLMSVTYTLPDAGARAIFSHLPRLHRRGLYHLGSLALSNSVGQSPLPIVLGISREVTGVQFGDYQAVLDAPEGLVFAVPFSVTPVR